MSLRFQPTEQYGSEAVTLGVEALAEAYDVILKNPSFQGQSVFYVRINRWVDNQHPMSEAEFQTCFGMSTEEYFSVYQRPGANDDLPLAPYADAAPPHLLAAGESGGRGRISC